MFSQKKCFYWLTLNCAVLVARNYANLVNLSMLLVCYYLHDTQNFIFKYMYIKLKTIWTLIFFHYYWTHTQLRNASKLEHNQG